MPQVTPGRFAGSGRDRQAGQGRTRAGPGRRSGQAVAQAGAVGGAGRAVGGAADSMRHDPQDPEDQGTSFYWFALTLARFVLYLGSGN
jgi:hypothetical protein